MTKIALFLLIGLCCACQPDLNHQPRLNPYAESILVADHQGARPLPPGVIPQSENSQTSLPVTKEFLLRGQDRYQIYCQVCHGSEGRGDGLLTTRGFPKVPSLLASDNLKKSTDQLIQVIESGQGIMKSYKAQLNFQDRQAVAAYIKVLQASQHWPVSELPHDDLKKLGLTQ